MKTCPQCQVKYPDALEFCPRDGSPLPAAPGAPQDRGDPIIGTTIDGRYAIEARLGEGGMGVVYKAKHVLIDKPVAIKILRKEAAQDSASVQRFIQEAKSASKIGHSNIVDITDFGVLPDGHAYFVMEFLQGPTLAQALQDGPLDPARVCTIGAQMARGLHAAHQKGIVHRDLKPENIFLLEREGQKDFVKVVDFGIAKVGSGQRLTQVGMVLGTPEYMSPEQATGQDTDHRVDQYALGCMMYEMLTGVVPFLGERPAQTLTKHVFEAVQPPRQRKPELNIPVSLEAVIMRTLAKKAAERFPSMRELELALQQVESELRSGRVVVDDSRLLYSGQVPLATPQEVAPAPSAPQVAPQAAPTQAYPQQPYAAPTYAPAAPSVSSGPAAYPAYPSYPAGVAAPAAGQPQAYAPPAAAPAGQPQAYAAPAAPAVGQPPAYAPSFVSSPAMAAYASQVGQPGQPGAYPSQPGVPAYPAPYPSSPVATGYESGGVRPTRQTTKTSARRFGPLAAAGIGAVLVLGLLAVYLLVIDKPPPAPQPAPTPTATPEPVRSPPPTPTPEPARTPPPPQAPVEPAQPARVQLMLRSTPSGANVYINGERAGQTPLSLTKDRGASFLLELRKGGYQPLVKEVVASESQEMPLSLLRKGEKRKRGREPKEAREVHDASPPSPPPQQQTGGLRNPFGPKK